MAMLEKLFSRNRPQKLIPENGQQRVIPEADYQRYVFYEELFHKIVATEAALHNMEDPQEIAIGVMKAACDLYDADWSGILLERDPDSGSSLADVASRDLVRCTYRTDDGDAVS